MIRATRKVECLEVRALLAATISDAQDNVADFTGSFASGTTINDSTPTFTIGTNLADTFADAAIHTVPGDVLVEAFNQVAIGGTVTPTSALADGSYVLRVLADNGSTNNPAGGIASGSAEATFNFTVDTTAPTADIVDVFPDPLTAPNAGTVTINFSEAVTGVDINDFSLTRTTVADGTVVVDISGLVVGGAGLSYTINLSTVTTAEGVYDLTLTATGAGIQDLAGNALTADATDNWVLPCTLASLSGGVLTLTDTGTATDSEYSVMVGVGDGGGPNAGNPVLIISDPNGLSVGAGGYQINNTTIEVPLASLTGTTMIFGGAGDDSLELDLTGGPINLIFHGGDGMDAIEITNFNASGMLDSYTANYSTPTSGNVQLQFAGVVQGTLTYSGVEPLSIDGTPTDIILNLTNANDGDATLADIGGADGIMELSGTTFETTTFSIGGATSLTINGRGGRDLITVDSLDAGFTGLLIITGGTGNDTLIGSAYNESLDGGAGADSITGGDGDDTITGGAGNDILAGGNGTDTLADTTSGNLTLTNTQLNGNGSDMHTGMEQAVLSGNFNPNRISASAFTLGPVTLSGGDGNDTLLGTMGVDSLEGGNGSDRVEMTISGTVVLFDATLDVNGVIDDLLSIENVALVGGDDGDEVDASGFSGRVTVFGGSGDDLFTASAGGSLLDGNGGADTLVGGPGNDLLLGGSGNDTMDGNDGHDVLRGNTGDDLMSGGTGNDRLHGEGGFDTLTGGDDNDTLDGGLLADTLTGEAGNDSLLGGPGFDSLSGGDDNDFINGNEGNDSLEGNAGNDTLRGGAGNDRQLGGTGDDQLFSDMGNDTLSGEQGNDSLTGAGGQDAMSGGSGNDFLNGNDGNDTLLGDTGDDSILGGAGIDSIISGDGNDTVRGQGGRDVISFDDDDVVFASAREIVAAFTFDFGALLV